MKIDDKTGLVLEGGGMRGVFTCGVLDYMMDKKVWFPYGVGVSAGACNGLSYMSRHHLINYLKLFYLNFPLIKF